MIIYLIRRFEAAKRGSSLKRVVDLALFYQEYLPIFFAWMSAYLRVKEGLYKTLL